MPVILFPPSDHVPLQSLPQDLAQTRAQGRLESGHCRSDRGAASSGGWMALSRVPGHLGWAGTEGRHFASVPAGCTRHFPRHGCSPSPASPTSGTHDIPIGPGNPQLPLGGRKCWLTGEARGGSGKAGHDSH